MLRKILKWSAAALAAVLVLLVVSLLLIFLFRTDPLGPIPGNRLSGPEVVEPVDDWSFADEQLPLAAFCKAGFEWFTTVTSAPATMTCCAK